MKTKIHVQQYIYFKFKYFKTLHMESEVYHICRETLVMHNIVSLLVVFALILPVMVEPNFIAF